MKFGPWAVIVLLAIGALAAIGRADRRAANAEAAADACLHKLSDLEDKVESLETAVGEKADESDLMTKADADDLDELAGRVSDLER